MFALKLALVAASILLASLAARRFGHGVSGTLGGMPMIAGPIMGFVLLEQPAEQARAIALATLVCLPAMVLHMVTFAHAARRLPWYGALLAANAVFVAAGWLLWQLALPPAAVCAAALLAPPAGMLAIHVGGTAAPGAAVAIPRAELVLRVLVAIVLAAGIMQGAALLPTMVSGLLLALPITGNVLPCFTLPRHGAAATAALLRGFLWGLFGFVAFFVALFAALPWCGAAASYGLAWLAAIVVALSVYRARWRARAAPRRRSDPKAPRVARRLTPLALPIACGWWRRAAPTESAAADAVGAGFPRRHALTLKASRGSRPDGRYTGWLPCEPADVLRHARSPEPKTAARRRGRRWSGTRGASPPMRAGRRSWPRPAARPSTSTPGPAANTSTATCNGLARSSPTASASGSNT